MSRLSIEDLLSQKAIDPKRGELKVTDEIKTMTVTSRQSITPFTFEVASARGSRPRRALS